MCCIRRILIQTLILHHSSHCLCIFAIYWMDVSRTKFGNDSRQFKIIENTLFNLFIILTYVLFPSLCATIFSSFVCENFDDGSSYLRSDYSVDCDSSDYTSIYSLAIIMIFVYPIGIPLMALISKSNEFYVTFWKNLSLKKNSEWYVIYVVLTFIKFT